MPRARPRADRGLLRRARLAHRRPPGRDVRRRGDLLVLSRPPHDDRRGRRGRRATTPSWVRALGSLREWGRDCWCPPGMDGVCGRRFEGRFGELPAGLRPQVRLLARRASTSRSPTCRPRWASSQLEQARRLRRGAAASTPRTSPRRSRRSRTGSSCRGRCPGADPSWFGFPLTLREGGADRRRRLQQFLLERRIDTRLLLAGNLVRQPGFRGREHRVAGELTHADRITEASLWVGCWPGLSTQMLDWIVESVGDFLATG